MENKKRLVDVAKEIQTMYSLPETRRILETDSNARKVLDWIYHAPTVDAVEVVHGYTLIADEPKKVLLDRKCSICDQLMLATDDYCPMCGAKMDGDGNG